MDIEKPDTLQVTSQPLDWKGTMHCCFTVSLGFDLHSGTLLPVDKVWAAAMRDLGPGDCLDTGLPKQQAEWLLAGSARTPGDTPLPGLVVDIRIGTMHRRFLVSGEKKSASAAPAPFTAMPLIWANTWGGPSLPENPLGCGLAVDPAIGLIRQPTVTDANLPHGRPACPGPVGSWPCRMRNLGTYDETWLKTRWPGVPDDFDWTFFNLAQPSQRFPEALQGDESVELSGLHPDHPTLATRLPGKPLRVSIRRKGREDWKSIPATLDTLWLFPNSLAGLLLWHAMTEAADEAASDIAAVRLHLEPEQVAETGASDVSAPLPLETLLPSADGAGMAAAVMGGVAATAAAVAGITTQTGHQHEEARSIPATETVSSQATTSVSAEKAPEPVLQAPGPLSPLAAETDKLRDTALDNLDQHLEEINAALVKQGFPPMTPEQIAETRQRIQDTTASMRQILLEASSQPDTDTLLSQAGVSEERIAAFHKALELEKPDPETIADPAAWNAAIDSFLTQFDSLLQPPDNVRALLRSTLELQGPNRGQHLNALVGPKPDPHALLVQHGMDPAKASILLDMLNTENLPSGATLEELEAYGQNMERALGFPTDSVSGRIREVRYALQQKGFLKQQPVANPEAPVTEPLVSKSDSAKTFSSSPEAPVADPEASSSQAPANGRELVLLALVGGAPLAGASLAGADLSGLDLSGQDLSGASLQGANLTGSRLDQANLSGANLTNADLSACSCANANLSSADLSGAKAPGAAFVRTDLHNARLDNIQAPDTDFSEASLEGASLQGADLTGAQLYRVQGAGLNAEGALLQGAKLRFCDCSKANFSQADLGRADFHQAILDQAGFQKANLTGATFVSGTTATGADFSQSTLADSVWQNAAAPGGVFTGTAATGARFNDCDLSASSWRAATARNADFSRSSLQGADFRRADLFHASLREARAQGADLSGANLYSADLYRFGMDQTTRKTGTNLASTVLSARGEA